MVEDTIQEEDMIEITVETIIPVETVVKEDPEEETMEIRNMKYS